MKTMIGLLFVFRCDKAGVFAAKVEAIDEANQKIKLSDAHRLWKWQAKDGISLSDVANNGVEDGKISKGVNVWINNNDVYEAIEMNAPAFETIKSHAGEF